MGSSNVQRKDFVTLSVVAVVLQLVLLASSFQALAAAEGCDDRAKDLIPRLIDLPFNSNLSMQENRALEAGLREFYLLHYHIQMVAFDEPCVLSAAEGEMVLRIRKIQTRDAVVMRVHVPTRGEGQFIFKRGHWMEENPDKGKFFRPAQITSSIAVPILPQERLTILALLKQLSALPLEVPTQGGFYDGAWWVVEFHKESGTELLFRKPGQDATLEKVIALLAKFAQQVDER
jgi:hypothetical protein